MSISSPSKSHKRFAPSRTGSDFSFSTTYSSSSTLVLQDIFLTPPAPTPRKPWAIKALNQLGMKCKKSMVFTKGKKESKDSLAKEEDEESQTSPYTKMAPPFILDISREAVARAKERELEEHEELDLLPDCPPQILRKAPSSNALMQFQGSRRHSPLSDLRTGSTPDLRLKSRRDSFEDPFYLEALLREFPRPPVHNPGEYAPRQPVDPRMRRPNANFSLPSSKAYPERKKIQPKHWVDRPVPRDVFQSEEPPSFTGKSNYTLTSDT